jgi:MYXO-CTERM domain-containing protein
VRIAVWSAKYAYGFWRPVTSINSPVDDGNPDTTADPEGDWLPLLETPNHPEYVSGHSATGAAGAAVLAAWFGDSNSFAVTSETLVGAAYTRSFTRFSDAAQENADSRIYGGIHYRFSNEAGLALGEKVADYVLSHQLAAFPIVGEGGAGGAAAGGSGAGGEDDALGGAPATAGTGGTSAGTGGTADTAGNAGKPNVGGSAGTTSQPSGDAGAEASPEGGAPGGAGAGSAGKPAGHGDDSDDSGCSVSAPSGSSGSTSLLLLLGLVGVLTQRKTRRLSSSDTQLPR